MKLNAIYGTTYKDLEKENKQLKEEIYDLLRKKRDLKERIDKTIEFIKENFTNNDGTIWHEEMKIIYEILGGKK